MCLYIGYLLFVHLYFVNEILSIAKACDKSDHGVLLHKIKTLGITGKLGVWLYQFLTHITHFVILHGGINKNV